MKPVKVVLVGQPNAGKSTLFNLLSDIKANCSNFAGTTVTVNSCQLQEEELQISLLDLPGLYSLNSVDEAEKVTLDYLLREKVDLILNVIDSSLLARSLELTIELLELQIPMIIVCNMEDQALEKGFRIDLGKLAQLTGCRTHSISALYNRGIKELMEQIKDAARSPLRVSPLKYTAHIEQEIGLLSRSISYQNPNRVPPRFFAIKLIENPEAVPERAAAGTGEILRTIVAKIEREHQREAMETISYERHHLAMMLSEESVIYVRKKNISRAETMDRFLLHPVLGNGLMLFFFGTFFSLVFFCGKYLALGLDFALSPLGELYRGVQHTQPLLFSTIDGLYQGFAGGIGIVLPYLLPLVLLNSLVQDSGYLSRIAFLADSLMHRLGLHGKAVVTFINGMACTVPAIYSSRIMERKRDRFILAMLLPLIPCSARNAVILALSAALLGPLWAIAIYFFILLIVAVSGLFLAKFTRGAEGLIMEMPRLRRPLLRVAALSAFYQVKDFFRTVFPILLISSVVLNWLFYLHLDTALNSLLSFFVSSLLGLPEALGSTLLFGFLRKELILVMASQALGAESLALLPLSAIQTATFILFTVLYFPCLATFIVLKREFGWKTALLSAAFSLAVALLFSNLLRVILLLFRA